MFEDLDHESSQTQLKQLEEPIEKEQIIHMIQETFEKALKVRELRHPQVEIEAILLEASLLYRRVITYFKDDQEIALALSMLWKYVLTMFDCVLYKKEEEIGYINNTIDKKVAEKVENAMYDSRLEKLTLQNKVIDLKKQVSERDDLLSSKTEYLRKIQDNLK